MTTARKGATCPRLESLPIPGAGFLFVLGAIVATIKAIETQYKGHRFRSRLEARWAVFFDTMRIEWRYEPEGFEMSDGTRYLPDFYLPRFDIYVEIKPPVITFQDACKMGRFAYESGKDLLLISDCPLKETMFLMRANTWGGPMGWLDPMTENEDEAMDFWVENDVVQKRVKFEICPFTHNWTLRFVIHSDEMVAESLKKAASARFEFGEEG